MEHPPLYCHGQQSNLPFEDAFWNRQKDCGTEMGVMAVYSNPKELLLGCPKCGTVAICRTNGCQYHLTPKLVQQEGQCWCSADLTYTNGMLASGELTEIISCPEGHLWFTRKIVVDLTPDDAIAKELQML